MLSAFSIKIRINKEKTDANATRAKLLIIKSKSVNEIKVAIRNATQ
jgi:hypothetical protein